MDPDKSQEYCSCNAYSEKDQRVDIKNTTACPYCGIIFDSSRDVLVHIFTFHPG